MGTHISYLHGLYDQFDGFKAFGIALWFHIRVGLVWGKFVSSCVWWTVQAPGYIEMQNFGFIALFSDASSSIVSVIVMPGHARAWYEDWIL